MYSVFPATRAHRQRGAALILALVIFGVVALLATSLSMDFLVSVRRAENQLHGQQARAYLQGAEGLARNALIVDYKGSNQKDHISEGWLDSPQEYPMDTGVIQGTICDLQGRFNLNNLPGTAATPGAFTADQQLFVRLLQALPLPSPLDQNEAEAIANAVIDWIDRDSNTRNPGGAEDGYYSDQEPPYRAGNQRLYRVSELRWVKGVSDEIYRALEPHVAALPQGVGLNVNTADRLLLRSINQTGNPALLSESDTEGLIYDRDGDIASGDPAKMNSGFATVAEFVTADPLLTAPPAGMSLAVRSDYFLLDTAVLFLDRTYTQHALIRRDSDGKTATVARGQNGLGSCPQRP